MAYRSSLWAACLLSAGCLLEFPGRLLALDAACDDPGVLRCFGFDDAMEAIPHLGQEGLTDEFCDGGACWRIDPTVRVSGTGALRLEVASGSWGPPLFRMNFSQDLSRQVGEGEDLYIQWQQRFSPDILRMYRGTDGYDYDGGWQQIYVADGDLPGAEPTDQCAANQVLVGQDPRFNGPIMSHGCSSIVPLEVSRGNEVFLQTGEDAACGYANGSPTAPPCIAYPVDRWAAYLLHVQIGTFGQPSSRIQLFMTEPGSERLTVFDSTDQAIGDEGTGYGKVWLGPQMWRRDQTEDHPPGYTWVDNLVVSSEPIPDPP